MSNVETPTDINGELSVNLKLEPHMLDKPLPIEIRDSNFKVIEKASRKRTFDLPEGLYQVSAVLHDGERHTEVVQVTGGHTTPVTLGSDPSKPSQQPAGEVSQFDKVVRAPFELPRGLSNILHLDVLGNAVSKQLRSILGTRQATFIDAIGAEKTGGDELSWHFQCNNDIDSVPVARFQIGKQIRAISLPISSQHAATACTVSVKKPQTAQQLRAWMSPEREGGSILQNMVAAGHVLEAANVADNAQELLRDKYADAPAAALGALMLLKTGRIAHRVSWVENLVNDFDWLPDGKVILAQILSARGERDVARGLALKASSQRMLYTESYSLLLDLMRRWPDEDQDDGWRSATAGLAARAPYIDWQSICLNDHVAE